MVAFQSVKIAQTIGSKFKLKTRYMDDIWQSISTATVIIPSYLCLNVLECHSEYGWESLSAGAVEQAKKCFKTMNFTHCKELKYGCYSWGQAPYFKGSSSLDVLIQIVFVTE